MGSESESLTSANVTQLAAHPILRILRQHDFRLLWIGQGISLLGDQFYLISLPWLVLRLSGDPIVLGMVLALGSLPRALFVLFGGAASDRFSPRTVMISSDLGRSLLTALLVLLLLTNVLQLWMLYVFALLFGVVSGIFLPTSNTLLPSLVRKEDLQTANAVFNGTMEASVFIGPALAGTVIGVAALHSTGNGLAHTQAPGEMQNLALAFGIDSLTFLVSVITLWMIRFRPVSAGAGTTPGLARMLAEIGGGIRFVWQDRLLRIIFLDVAAINMFFSAPLLVGIPLLANTQLGVGAVGFGMMISALGAGNLIGSILAGLIPRARWVGLQVVAITAIFGLGFLLLNLVSNLLVACLLLLVVCMANGYVVVIGMTWLQLRVPSEMMGRVMALITLAIVGLVPAGQILAGLISTWSLNGMFTGAGVLLLLTAVVAILAPEMWAS